MVEIKANANLKDSYRGQRALVVKAIRSGAKNFDAVVKAVTPEYAKTEKHPTDPKAWFFTKAGAVAGSVRYHLKGLAKDKEITLTGDFPKIAGKALAPVKKAA